MFDQLEQGKIKAVWVACTNPAHSLPNSQKVARALQNAELVVVQDAYLTPATVQYADVLLPATTWGEKEGTVTNSERRISRVQPAMPAYGESKNDWQIVVDFAQRLEQELLKLGVESPRLDCPQIDSPNIEGSQPAAAGKAFLHYSTVEEIFNEHRETTRGRDLDITGLSYAVLETIGPQQWPMPEGETQGKARLYEDGVYPTATGRAKFVFAPYEPVAEEADARFPWRLNTGRLRDQWHGASRTGTLAEFFSHEAEPVICLHPADFKRLSLTPNSWVSVKSRRATITLRAKADESVARNQAVLPMHWGPEFFGGKAGVGGVNALTTEAFDPYSKQPELKHAAVNIQRVQLPWQVVAFVHSEKWLSLWQQARALYPEFDAAVCVPVGREQAGVLFRAACAEAPAKDVIDRLQALFECDGSDVMVYSDPKTGVRRRIGVLVRTTGKEQTATLTKVLLAGNIESEGWLRNCFDLQLDVMPWRSFLLAPASQPPGVQTQAVQMVCNCIGVSRQAMEAGLAIACAKEPGSSEAEQLASLQASLKCGTQCGSCVPEIRKLIRAQSSLVTIAP
jgi:assimilatory nitrate reductase catalytic subunit